MKPKQSVPLLLSVSDIKQYNSSDLFFPTSRSFSNSVGQIKNCVADVSWNIDLKTLLGDLYDKYEYFNLELLQFMTIPYSGSPNTFSKPFQNNVNTGYRNLSIYISGLQWVNSSYSQKNDVNTNYCHLCNIQQQFTTQNTVAVGDWRNDEYLYESIKGYDKFDLMFKKQQFVTINIRIGAIDSDLDYTPESIFIYSSFIMHYFLIKFNIVPFK